MVFTCAPCKAIGKVPHQWPTSSKKLNHKAKCKSNQVIKNHGFIRPYKVAVHAHALVHLSLSYCHPAFLLSCPLALLLATLLILCSPALKFSRSLDLLLSSCPVVLSSCPPSHLSQHTPQQNVARPEVATSPARPVKTAGQETSPAPPAGEQVRIS